jgi:hypothetical protein
MHNNVQDPAALWDKYKLDMCEDFLHAERQVNPDRTLYGQVWDQALLDIEKHLIIVRLRMPLEVSSAVEMHPEGCGRV